MLECWTPNQKPMPNGYVNRTIFVDGKRSWGYVHRLVYEAVIGEIPQDLQIDHLCRNRFCANPEHLQPVTPRENLARADVWSVRRDKTHCKYGHEFTEANTYKWRNSRHCRTCAKKRVKGTTK